MSASTSHKDPKAATIMLAANSCWNLVNFRAGMIRGLQAAGYRVGAVAPTDSAAEQLVGLGVEHHPLSLNMRNMAPIQDLGLLRDYRRLFRRTTPAIVLAFTPKPNAFASLAAAQLGIPVINNMTGMAFVERGWLGRNVPLLLLKAAFRKSKVVFFQNPDDRALFLGRKIVREDQARLLPGSGIDLQHFVPGPAPMRLAEGPVFLLVARLLREKGVEEFVAAAREVRPSHRARFQLLGLVDAPNASAIGREDVDRWVEEGVIEYLGDCEDVRPHIAAADFVALPSYREGLPRALLEGAAMAKPLLATDVPGCREIVEHKVNGYLCAVRDPRSLAEGMEWLIGCSLEKAEEMGRASRSKAEAQFDQRIVIDRYIDAVTDILRR